MKRKEDLLAYLSDNYNESVHRYIDNILVESVVKCKYSYPDNMWEDGPDGYYFYYDIESNLNLIDIVVEDDTPDTLLFHLLFEVVYDELFIHPISICQVYRHYEERGLSNYVSVDLRGFAEDGFKNLKIVDDSSFLITENDVNKYHSKYLKCLLFDDMLLPRIYSEKDLVFATDIALNRYCPNYGSSNEMKIDPKILASSMGLKVVETWGLQNNVEGIVFFDNGTYTASAAFDMFEAILTEDGFEPQSVSPVEAEPGTIVIDVVNAYPARLTNTIAHECVHWFLHRKPYLLQVLLGESAPKISCRSNTMSGSRFGDYFQRREWQASNLSPRLLLGNRNVVEEVISRTKEKHKKKEKILPDCIEDTITELSDETGLSRNAITVQFKMKRKGAYEGVLPYCEGHYIRSYIYKGNLRWGETFNISRTEFENLYANNPELQVLIASGLFDFVENHICLITPETVKLAKDQVLLTDKVRLRMDSYCLRFYGTTYRYPSGDEVLSGAFRAITKSDNDRFLEFSNSSFPSKEYMELAKRRKEDVLTVTQQLNGRLDHDLKILYDWSEFKKAEVYREACLDKNTFNKILSGTTKSIKIDTAIKLCIGLQLPKELAECLLKAANLELDSSMLHVAYQYIIDHFTFEPLSKIDEFLLTHDLPVLGYA